MTATRMRLVKMMLAGRPWLLLAETAKSVFGFYKNFVSEMYTCPLRRSDFGSTDHKNAAVERIKSNLKIRRFLQSLVPKRVQLSLHFYFLFNVRSCCA